MQWTQPDRATGVAEVAGAPPRRHGLKLVMYGVVVVAFAAFAAAVAAATGAD